VIAREFPGSRMIVEIDNAEDQDGDRFIMVKVRHLLANTPVRVSGFLAKDGKVRDEAWRQGIRRFVHIRHLFDENQKVAG